MRQRTLFDNCHCVSPAEELRTIRLVFLRQLAAGQEADAGVGQRNDPYPPGVRNAIGPMISGLHRDGIIMMAGAGYASRPTRRRTVARLWRAVNPERCRLLAEIDSAWLAERQKVAGDSVAAESPAVAHTSER